MCSFVGCTSDKGEGSETAQATTASVVTKQTSEAAETESANVVKNNQQLLELAKAISYGNEDVIREISNCISDTEHYFDANSEQYEER